MKKYIKPIIVFESFTLSTNIAADCNVMTNDYIDFHSCGIWFDGLGFMFTSDWAGCVENPPPADGGEFYGFCYHYPSDDTRLFNS